MLNDKNGFIVRWLECFGHFDFRICPSTLLRAVSLSNISDFDIRISDFAQGIHPIGVAIDLFVTYIRDTTLEAISK